VARRRFHYNCSKGTRRLTSICNLSILEEQTWCRAFIPMIMQRGGVLIQKWGRSSAASTAVSIVDAMRSLVTPTPEGDWFSTGVIFSDFWMVHFSLLLCCASEATPMLNLGLYDRKSLWHSRGHCIQHAMQIEGTVLFRNSPAFLPDIRQCSNWDYGIMHTG
jgi:hypothetical protein